MEPREGTTEGLGPLASVVEGINSLNQVLGQLVVAELPGAATGREALQTVVHDGQPRNGLTTEFTALVPLGVNGPLNLQGKGFPDPISTGSDNKRALAASTHAGLRALKAKRQNHSVGGTCPVTSSYRGDQDLFEAAPAATDGPPSITSSQAFSF
ncbi:MAG: hypothetical protein ACT4TC_20360 [Myxococcaceae bacterium]